MDLLKNAGRMKDYFAATNTMKTKLMAIGDSEAEEMVPAYNAEVRATYGYCPDSAIDVQKAFPKASVYTTRLKLAFALARCDRTNEAMKLFEQVQNERPNDVIVAELYEPYLRALTLMRSKQFAEATAALQGIYRFGWICPMLFLDRGYAKLGAGRTQEAIEDFQKLSARRDVAILDSLDTLAKLGLARSYVALNDIPKARTAYQDVFADWKNADADLPPLVQAKAEYAKLN